MQDAEKSIIGLLSGNVKVSELLAQEEKIITFLTEAYGKNVKLEDIEKMKEKTYAEMNEELDKCGVE
jgi:hypothetical protein